MTLTFPFARWLKRVLVSCLWQGQTIVVLVAQVLWLRVLVLLVVVSCVLSVRLPPVMIVLALVVLLLVVFLTVWLCVRRSFVLLCGQ